MHFFRIFILIFAINFISISCRPKVVLKYSKPDIFLSEKQLTSILVDAQLVEGALSLEKDRGENFKLLKTNYYKLIFQEHGITDKVFEENMIYYNQTPEKLEKVYEEVIAELVKKQSVTKPDSEE
jgi:hypothetical protein